MGGSASTQSEEVYWDFQTSPHGSSCHQHHERHHEHPHDHHHQHPHPHPHDPHHGHSHEHLHEHHHGHSYEHLHEHHHHDNPHDPHHDHPHDHHHEHLHEHLHEHHHGHSYEHLHEHHHHDNPHDPHHDHPHDPHHEHSHEHLHEHHHGHPHEHHHVHPHHEHSKEHLHEHHHPHHDHSSHSSHHHSSLSSHLHSSHHHSSHLCFGDPIAIASAHGCTGVCTSWPLQVPPCRHNVVTEDFGCTASLPDKHCYKYTANMQVASPGRHFVTIALDPNTFVKDTEKEREFLTIVATSIVGFLNTGEGGIICAGITDLGYPLGFALTQRRMGELQWMVERCVEEIQPDVARDLYTLSFQRIFGVPFIIQPYPHTQQEIRLMEIVVRPILRVSQLFTWRGIPYMRRDGGTYRMTMKEIDWHGKLKQAWHTAQMHKELDTLRGHLQEIKKGLKESLGICDDVSSDSCQENVKQEHHERKPRHPWTGCSA